MGYTGQLKRDYQRRWLKARREVWVKEHGPCAKCRSWKDLQVDHINPKTKLSHRVWSWSQERRDKELSKCQVLCKECHDKKTNLQRGRGVTIHGSMQRGYRRGCRCKECSKANAARVARRRKILAR